MTVLQLEAEVTDTGELRLELPTPLPPGRARITIEIPAEECLSSEEIKDLMAVEPLSGAKIVEAGLTGGWADQGITDANTWVQERRHRRREKRTW